MTALLDLVTDESKWLTLALACALLAVAGVLLRSRQLDAGRERRIMAALTLGFAVTIATMALGHLLAVTVKLVSGTLGDTPPPLLYAIGFAMALPAGLLIRHSGRVLRGVGDWKRGSLVLHGWLVLTLLALGPRNFPLAAPGVLSLGYQWRPGGAIGWAILGVAAVVYLGLFIGSLVFFLSGQSFEQFSGGGVR